jgi:hypothetical protein
MLSTGESAHPRPRNLWYRYSHVDTKVWTFLAEKPFRVRIFQNLSYDLLFNNANADKVWFSITVLSNPITILQYYFYLILGFIYIY